MTGAGTADAVQSSWLGGTPPGRDLRGEGGEDLRQGKGGKDLREEKGEKISGGDFPGDPMG